jgi:hypothetical protein
MTEPRKGASRHVALIKALFSLPKKRASEIQRAMDLIAAIDAGGLPLHPARVNDIARQLGLEVSSRARMEETILRIRAALAARPPD